jgi:hypothetical protein
MTVHQYDKWLCKTVHDLCWFDLYVQNKCRLCCFMGYSEIASWCGFPPYCIEDHGVTLLTVASWSQLLSMTVHQYDKWLCKTVHDLCWFDLYGQNNQLIVNFILCQGNLNFCSDLEKNLNKSFRKSYFLTF